MMKKRFFKIAFFVLMALILNLFVINFAEINFDSRIEFVISSPVKDEFQIFFDNNSNWQEQNSQKFPYTEENSKEKFTFFIPKGSTNIRLDFGNGLETSNLWSINLIHGNQFMDLSNKVHESQITNDISDITTEEDKLIINKTNNDSYVVLDLTEEITYLEKTFGNRINNIVRIICLVLVNGIILGLAIKRRYVFSILKEIYNSRILVWNLSKNDFKTKYAGSYLGIFWAFVNPVVTILIYWFVFEFGLRAGAPIPNVPFILWFTSGLIPWFFFSDAVLNATNSFIEYSYLVKKVVFKISILPIVKIISALFIHIVFVGVMVFIYTIYGRVPTISFIQLFYYSFCTFALALAISYATSAIVIFFKDLTQIIGIGLQIGMWMTPIMWSYTIIPIRFQWIPKINPMFYIVNGYRGALLENKWFFYDFWGTIYFWGFTIAIFVTGTIIFKKLKPHFSDVL